MKVLSFVKEVKARNNNDISLNIQNVSIFLKKTLKLI